MPARRITWLDVFTDRPLTGNALAVVHEADGLDPEVMHAFARETRLSETTFVQSPDVEDADYRNRIFMPTGEVPFAGHPSLGTAVAVAVERGETGTTYRQSTQAGVQPIDVELEGRRARASMLQEPPIFVGELDPADVLGRAGLARADADPELGVQVVSTGVPQVLAFVRDEAVLARCAPDYDGVAELMERHSSLVLYVVFLDGERAVARSFMGTAEDPATGAAAGPLMALAHARTGVERLTIAQGHAMGRPSELHCSVEGDRVRVGGDVLVVFEGLLELDT